MKKACSPAVCGHAVRAHSQVSAPHVSFANDI